jgi:hypothetical protein
MNGDDDSGVVSISKQLEKNPPPDPLPAGWILRKSARSGAHYYYHMELGISQVRLSASKWPMTMYYMCVSAECTLKSFVVPFVRAL